MSDHAINEHPSRILNTIEKIRFWKNGLAEELELLFRKQCEDTFTLQAINIEVDTQDENKIEEVRIYLSTPAFDKTILTSACITVRSYYPSQPPIVQLLDEKGGKHKYTSLLLQLWKNERSVFNIYRLAQALIKQDFEREHTSPPELPTKLVNTIEKLKVKEENEAPPVIPAKPFSSSSEQHFRKVPALPSKLPPKPLKITANSSLGQETNSNSSSFQSTLFSLNTAPFSATSQQLVHDSVSLRRPSSNIPAQKPIPPKPEQNEIIITKDTPSLKDKYSKPALLPQKPKVSKGQIVQQVSVFSTGKKIESQSLLNLIDTDIETPLKGSSELLYSEDFKPNVDPVKIQQILHKQNKIIEEKWISQIRISKNLEVKQRLLDQERHALETLAKNIENNRFILGKRRRKAREALQKLDNLKDLSVQELFIIPSERELKYYELKRKDEKLDEGIRALNQALHHESIMPASWLKGIKLLARQQFLIRDEMLQYS
ncbi:ESCRT-I complex subunit vps23 [Schizosaccharomyces pombe]